MERRYGCPLHQHMGEQFSSKIWWQITEVDFTSDPAVVDRSLILPVHLLAGLLYEELSKLDNAKVHWGCKFVGHAQDDSHVLVEAERKVRRRRSTWTSWLGMTVVAAASGEHYSTTRSEARLGMCKLWP